MSGSKRSRITAVTDFFYLRMRHRDAWGSARAETIAPERGIESFRGRKYCLLTTFRKSGAPVPTPVWFGIADGKLYLGSEAAVGKVKRIRGNPCVRIAPCTARGRPLGQPLKARARVLEPSESERAERAIAANYGPMRRLYEGAGKRLQIATVYIEVEPSSTAADSHSGPCRA